MKTYLCERCGEPFEYYGNRHPHYCPACQTYVASPEAKRIRLAQWREEDRLKKHTYKPLYEVDGRKLDHLDATLHLCKELGLTYAQYQVERTLALLPPIGTTPWNTPRLK